VEDHELVPNLAHEELDVDAAMRAAVVMAYISDSSGTK
jgi:hypothetical protein